MKKVITILGLFGLIFVQAQVGINQDAPKATLDIKPIKADGTAIEGLLIPRLTGSAVSKMDSTKIDESTMVYVASKATDAELRAKRNAELSQKGYYSWNGTKWELINTSGNSIWSKTANGVELNDSNLKDSIQYSKNGYRIFDKSKAIVNSFDVYEHTYSNISPVDSLDSYNYEQTLFKNVTKKTVGKYEYLSGKKIEAIVTADDAHPANIGMQALQISTIVDGNNTNNYGNASGIFARSSHSGSGRIGLVRAGYFDSFLGKKSKASQLTGVMSGAVTYSDSLTNKVVGSFSMGTVRGTGNVTNLIGQDVIVGGGKVETSSPDITANVENLYGTRYILGSKPGIAGRGGMTGTINNAYANYVNYQVDANTPINNVYGLYVEDLPNHAKGDKYAIYTKRGKVFFQDTLTAMNRIGIGTLKPKSKLHISDGTSKNGIGNAIDITLSAKSLKYPTSEPVVYGNNFRFVVNDSIPTNEFYGSQSVTNIEKGAKYLKKIVGSYVEAASTTSTDSIGLLIARRSHVIHGGANIVKSMVGHQIQTGFIGGVDSNNPKLNLSGGTIKNQIGLEIMSVNRGTDSNYAIHTGEGEVSLGDVLILRKPGTAPTSPTDSSGKNGEIRYDGNYIYIKVGGQWKRTAFDTW